MLMTLSGWSIKRSAAIGITAQFLALIRTLSEVFRIKYFDADRYTLPALEAFVGASLFTAVLVAVAVAVFALGRYRIAFAIAAVNVGTLFVYKLVMM